MLLAAQNSSFYFKSCADMELSKDKKELLERRTVPRVRKFDHHCDPI